MQLTTPAITATTAETARCLLLEEWLGKYFKPVLDLAGNDLIRQQEWKGYREAGLSRVVGGSRQRIPPADIHFTDGPFPHPRPGVIIRMTWLSPITTYRKTHTFAGRQQEMIHQKFAWMFWVRANFDRSRDAHAASKTSAELLYKLFSNPASWRPLIRKGIYKICPDKPKFVANGADYEMRLVVVEAHVRYAAVSEV